MAAQALDKLHRARTAVDLVAQVVVHELDHLLHQDRPLVAWHAQSVGEEIGGKREAGADDRHLVVPGELRPAACEELRLRPVPEQLRVEKQPVHVEDDRPEAIAQELAHAPATKNEPPLSASERSNGITR